MGRGGYISTEVAVRKLNAVLGSREQARQFLIDALISEQLDARGKPILPKPPAPRQAGRMILRNLLSDREPSEYGPEAAIPSRFWTNADPRDFEGWDFQKGDFFRSDVEPCAYSVVKLEEKAVNALVRKHDPERNKEKKKPRQRRRTAAWPEWIAALVVSVRNHSVFAGQKQGAALARINDQLEAWGLDPCEDPTMGPATSEVLRRLKKLTEAEAGEGKNLKC